MWSSYISGVGKSILAKAIAGELQVAFRDVSVQELTCSEVGEAERKLAAIFRRAKSRSPCVLVFDDIETLFAGGSDKHEHSSSRGASSVGEHLFSNALPSEPTSRKRGAQEKLTDRNYLRSILFGVPGTACSLHAYLTTCIFIALIYYMRAAYTVACAATYRAGCLAGWGHGGRDL